MSERSVGSPRRAVPDAAFIDAIQALYPAETLTGGVKASQVAASLDLSTRRARTRMKRLHDEGRIRGLGGLRGPTYAPPPEEQSPRHGEPDKK